MKVAERHYLNGISTRINTPENIASYTLTADDNEEFGRLGSVFFGDGFTLCML